MLRLLIPALAATMLSPVGHAGALSLTLYYSNGSLPPPYHFHYRIEIERDGSAELSYTRGYEGPAKTASYTLAAETLAALERQARALAAVKDSFAAAENKPRPVGGATTHARIVLDGEVLMLPTTFNQPHAEALDAFYREVRDTIPDDAWAAVKAEERE